VLYLGRSHTDTLHAFHVTSQGVVFAPDLVFIHMIPPGGLPQTYAPGHIEALDRVASLDPEFVVPSHGWDIGTPEELAEFREMLAFTRKICAEQIAIGGLFPDSKARADMLFTTLDAMEQRSGPEPFGGKRYTFTGPR